MHHARRTMLLLAGCSVVVSCAPSLEQRRQTFDASVASIEERADRAELEGNYEQLSAEIDELIHACLDSMLPAARQAAGWYAGAEFTNLLNDGQYARAAERGARYFDLIVEWPESKAGMGEAILEHAHTPELLALATRFADHAEKNAKASRPVNAYELERVQNLRGQIAAATTQPAS